jgi:hypothetical protein
MMTRSLDSEVSSALRAAGVPITDERDAYRTLLLAVQERGLAYRVKESRRTRRYPNCFCRRYRARVRSLDRSSEHGRPWWWAAAGMTAKGRGETGTAALARAMLAWLT